MPAEAARRPGWQCADDVCRATIKGRAILYAHEAKAVPVLDCNADILIADFPLRGRCPPAAIRIDRFDVWRHGAYALFIQDQTISKRTAREEQGRRPWVIMPTPGKRLVLVPPR